MPEIETVFGDAVDSEDDIPGRPCIQPLHASPDILQHQSEVIELQAHNEWDELPLGGHKLAPLLILILNFQHGMYIFLDVIECDMSLPPADAGRVAIPFSL